MRCKNLKVFGFLLSSTLSMSCLGGCGESSNYNPAIYNQEQGITMSKRFETGEHYISVPLPNVISDKITQIESPEGYKVISLSYGSYGEICGFYGGGTILYTNSVPVICESNLYGDDEVPYLDFGTPIDYIATTKDKDDIREFKVGEHILSVPINVNVIDYNYQYEYHEGYEVFGISVATYGELSGFYDSGVILYKNTVPVKVQKSENGYVSFGIPIEPAKELNKK